ncbi:MAG: hypothetical protein ACFCD0_03130 [Gemmataceae bacterium]
MNADSIPENANPITPTREMNDDHDYILLLIQNHSGECVILILAVLVMVTMFVLIPQVIRSHSRRMEMAHVEHMKALEQGMEVPPTDDSMRAAGRATMLVPMVVVIAAGVVTCFVVANKAENIFGVTLTIWSVAGVVSLAAITGGVALIGRLAQLRLGKEDQEFSDNPLEG